MPHQGPLWMIMLLGLMLGGCDASPPAVLASPTGGYGPTTAATSAAVAGGAAVVVASGAPAMCARLASSQAVREIPASVNMLAAGETAERGSAGLRAAAADLDALAAGDGAGEAAKLRDVARSLTRLAQAGIADQAAAADAVRELTELGEVVQDRCRFPLGASPSPLR